MSQNTIARQLSHVLTEERKELERIMKTIKCATPTCPNPARWIAIPEGNRLGRDAPRRCQECCDAIWNAGGDVDAALARRAAEINKEKGRN